MRIKDGLSYLFIFVSFIFILNIPISITGNVILERFVSGNLFFGVVFLVFGIALLLIHSEGTLEKTLAQKVKESGKFVDNPLEIIRIAKKSGYYIGTEVKEGTPIFDMDGTRITVIPRRHISPGVYHGIINSLAKGESSFKRREYSA